MSDRLTLLRPDDWHIHLRDGAALPHTVAKAKKMKFLRMHHLPETTRGSNRQQTQTGDPSVMLMLILPAC